MAFSDSYLVFIVLSGLLGYVVLTLLWKYLKLRKRMAILSKIPGLKPEFFFGNARQFPGMNEKGLAFLTEQMKLRPKLSYGRLGPFIPNVNPFHPDTIKPILSGPEPKSDQIYSLLLAWLGEGLLVSNGKKWARSRRLITPAFHFDILKKYLLVNNQATDVLLNKLSQFSDEDVYFEAFSEISLFSFDVILQCAFSYKSDCQTFGSIHPYVKAIADLNHLVSERFMKFWLHNDFLYSFTSDGKKFNQACDYVHKVAEDIIKERKQKLEEDVRNNVETKCRDFLGILLTARDDDGVGMTSKEIRNEVDTFLFEGHDTTTSGISWCLYAIAKHPDIQTRIQAEIDDIVGQREHDDILWEDLAKLSYTTMVIKESMRIYTPVIFIQRKTTQPLSLEGYEIPIGTDINLVLWNVMNNPAVWDSPEEFRPERFTKENIDKRDPFSYVPFSAGPRNCIGQNFAMHEMKTVISRILRRFTLEVDPNHVVDRKLTAVMKAQNGINIKAVARTLIR